MKVAILSRAPGVLAAIQNRLTEHGCEYVWLDVLHPEGHIHDLRDVDAVILDEVDPDVRRLTELSVLEEWLFGSPCAPLVQMVLVSDHDHHLDGMSHLGKPIFVHRWHENFDGDEVCNIFEAERRAHADLL